MDFYSGMPAFRDPDGLVWIWDSQSKTYIKTTDDGLGPDRGHSTGGDNDLFNQNQIEHSEQEGVPELEGHMAAAMHGNPRINQVNCPLCQESTDSSACPKCGKDLTPEWNKKNDESIHYDNAPQEHHLDGMPEREPKRNRMKTDDSYPSMNLASSRACPQCGGGMEQGSYGWRCNACGLELDGPPEGHTSSVYEMAVKLARREITTADEWDDMFSGQGNAKVEIGKWLQDKQGQMFFEHGMHALHDKLAERNGVQYPAEVGALGSVFNDGTAETQRVFPGFNFNQQSTQQQLDQAFGGNFKLTGPLSGAGTTKGDVFQPIEIKGGMWVIQPHQSTQPLTGVAWVKERSNGSIPPRAILCAEHLQPEDISLWMNGVTAIITATGGLTSHAAYLASTEGIPVIVGIGEEYTKLETGNYLKIEPTTHTITVMPGATGDWSSEQKNDAWNQIMRYQLQRGGQVKPEYFAHIDEELAWRLANDATLDSCPECKSPMVKQASEQVCHTCGHKQPIIQMEAGALIPMALRAVAPSLLGGGEAGAAAGGMGGLMQKALQGGAFQVGQNALGGGGPQQPGAAPMSSPSPDASVPMPGSTSKVAGAFGEEEDGWATKNRGEDSNPDYSGSSPNAGSEKGDSPEQLKDVDGGGPKDSEGTDAEKADNQGDPELQDKAMKAFHLNLPLVIEYSESDEAGSDNPILVALDQLLEEAFPGYKDGHDQQDGATQGEDNPLLEAAEEVVGEDLDGDDEEGEDEDHKKAIESKEASLWHYAYDDLDDRQMDAQSNPDYKAWLHGDEDECETCHGAGEVGAGFDPQFNHKCIHCKGTGKKTSNDHHEDMAAMERSMGRDWDAEDNAADGGEVYECGCGKGEGDSDECENCHPKTAGMMPMVQPNGLQQQPGVGVNPTCPLCGQSHVQGTPCPTVNPMQNQVQQPMTSGPITPPQPTKVVTNTKLANWIAEADYHSDMDLPGATCPHCGGPGAEVGQNQVQCRQCGQVFPHEVTPRHLQAVPDAPFNPYAESDDANEAVERGFYSSAPVVDDEFAFFTAANEDHVQPDGVGSSQQQHHLHHPDRGSEWVDDQGAPLEEGQEYEMKTGQSAIPDRVTLERVLPDKITYTVDSGDVTYRHELTKQQVDTDGTTFTSAAPADQIVDSADGFQNQEAPIRPGQDAMPQVTDLSTPSTVHSTVSDSEHEIISLDNYTGSFHGDAAEDRSWLLSGSSSEGVEVDPALMAKLAGKDYDPREQRSFIEESGEARNLDRLDLAGTHYITDDTDEHFNW